MSDTDGFKEAGAQAGSMWDEKEPIRGFLRKVRENVGPNSSKVYDLEVEGEDELIGVWGSTVLDSRFEEIPVGSEVIVEYTGKPAGKNYKTYKVLFKEPEGASDAVDAPAKDDINQDIENGTAVDTSEVDAAFPPADKV